MELAEAAQRCRGELRLSELGYQRCERCLNFANHGPDIQPIATSEGLFHHPNCFFAREPYVRARKVEVVEWDKAVRASVWRDQIRQQIIGDEAAAQEALARMLPTGALEKEPTPMELRAALRDWWRVGRIDAATPEMVEQAEQRLTDLASRIGPDPSPETEEAWDFVLWETYRTSILEPGVLERLRADGDHKTARLVNSLAKVAFTAGRRAPRWGL